MPTAAIPAAYVTHENQAKAAAAGIWSSRLVMPWDWRRGHRVARRDDAGARSDGCAIKGNINQQGKKIYHVPGGRWYVQTGINESQGKRWFCSEAEARAAGWRRAQQ